MKEKQLIREAKKSGNSSAIILPIKDIGKKFIILPIKYKFLLKDLLDRIEKQLKKILSEILTVEEINYTRDIIEKLIEKPVSTWVGSTKRRVLKDYFLNLEKINDKNDLTNIIYLMETEKKPNTIIIKKIKSYLNDD